MASSVVVLSMLFFYPLGSDTMGIQWVALRLVRHGLLPYVGSWEPNFPGVLVFHLLPAYLFGNSEIGFRLCEIVFHLGVVLVLYNFLLRWQRPRTAFISCFLYCIILVGGGTLYCGQRDTFAAGLLIIALFSWCKAEAGSTRHLLISGFLFGLIALIRPVYAPLPLTAILIFHKRFAFKQIAGFLIATIAPLVLSILPYLWTGTLIEYYDTTILFLLRLYTHVITPSTEALRIVLYHYSPLFVFAVVGVIPVRQRQMSPSILIKSLSREERKLFVWMIIEIAVVIAIQQRFLIYHFALLLVLLSPIATVGIERAIQWLPRRIVWRVLAAILSSLLVIGFFIQMSAPIRKGAEYILSLKWANGEYGAPFLTDYGKMCRDMDDSVIHYLSLPQNAAGSVEICSYDARLRVRLDREEATRFLYFQAFSVTDAQKGHPNFQLAWRREFLNRILSVPARFVILNGYMMYWNFLPPRYGVDRDFRELDSILHTDYTLDTTFSSNEIYRIKSFTPTIHNHAGQR